MIWLAVLFLLGYLSPPLALLVVLLALMGAGGWRGTVRPRPPAQPGGLSPSRVHPHPHLRLVRGGRA